MIGTVRRCEQSAGVSCYMFISSKFLQFHLTKHQYRLKNLFAFHLAMFHLVGKTGHSETNRWNTMTINSMPSGSQCPKSASKDIPANFRRFEFMQIPSSGCTTAVDSLPIRWNIAKINNNENQLGLPTNPVEPLTCELGSRWLIIPLSVFICVHLWFHCSWSWT